MNELPFFTTICYDKNPEFIGKRLLEKVDAYFYLGGKKASVIPGHTKGNVEGVKFINSSSSYLITSLKVASYCTILIPAIMLAAKMFLRSIYKFYLVNPETPIDNQELLSVNQKQIIESFWKEHIASFKVCHGTTSLLLKHFTEYGISSTYPPALHDMITKVRAVWKNHEYDILPRSGYFKNFERRYDDAHLKQQIAVSFTADPFRQKEYTVGARGYGGEWIRELNQFIYEAKQANRKDLLTSEEKQIVMEMQSLIEVMQRIAPMKVKVPYYMISRQKEFCSFQEFESRVKSECLEWQSPEKLSAYLHTVSLPQLNDQKKIIENKYEITVYKTIHPKHLEFELIDSTTAFNYPMLDFNKPEELSSSQTGKLRIRLDTLCSELEEYQDSIFECTPTDRQTYIVTRKERWLNEKEKKSVELSKKKFAAHKLWLQKFNLS
ncbi:hypothetical protein [Candidatus Protochlamydia amoebophila]|uniref:Uncharacterized protein n=1 Tax=Protochlamydia amoebophila (strain UWE25) TaxID=264201 RepID=Q6MCZ6_PARUW|nr:hypothetical protein [Candidatus Protochlamydia amoebophila]CAF23553.1 unnamed protein product [Candidatus Protochlamydia amoebophila UWE25]